MKSQAERIKEFCEYHRDGDGECNNVVLKAWTDKHGLTLQDKYELAYFFAITYCVESAIILFLDKKQVFSHAEAWVAANKQKLVFQSDRKYIRMKDSFLRCINGFKSRADVGGFLKQVTEDGKIKLAKAIPYVSSWELFGRFSAFLFLETFVALTGTDIENTTIEWKKGNTATSGLLNVFGYDEAAAIFDKSEHLVFSAEIMDKMLNILIGNIRASGGSENVTEIETSLCAYRKFYKGSRYNGYYLDRMLEEIDLMAGDFPEISAELFEIRRKCYQPKYLGEMSGWRRIRPEMKKLYKEAGIIT